MAILRNKQEIKAKQIYNEEYRAGIEKTAIVMPSLMRRESKCTQIIIEQILEVQNKSSPSETLLHLESIAWALVGCHDSLSLTNLWKRIQDSVAKSFLISLQFWQKVSDYLSERLGNLLYQNPYPSFFPDCCVSEMSSVL